MPSVTLSSIRDFGQKKPFNKYFTTSKGATGGFSDTIYTPPPDQTLQLTAAVMAYNAGTDTSWLQIGVYNGTNNCLFFRGYNIAIQVTVGGVCDIPCDYPNTIQVDGVATTVTFTYWVSLVGWLYKRGEGSLD